MRTAPMEWAGELARLLECAPRGDDLRGVADVHLIDLIALFERGKGSISAVQAHAEIAFRASQVELQRRQDVPRLQLGRGIGDQIALARRITPKQASDQLSLRRILLETMPRTTRLLEHGEISEWAAHEVAKNVLVLSDTDRELVDREMESKLPSITASRSGHVARAKAQELDPAAAVKRAERAVAQRRVSLRPAPDGMSLLHAVLPTKEGVACFKALTLESKAAKSSGDSRGKGQIMADTLVERVTGVKSVHEIPVEINLLMTDTTLFSDDDSTAWMDGHPIPGRLARKIALGVVTGAPEIPPRAATDQESSIAADGELGPVEMDATAPPPGSSSPASEETPTSDMPRTFGESSPIEAPRIDGASPTVDDNYSERLRHDQRPPSRDVIEGTRWIRRLYTDPQSGELTSADPRRRLFRGSTRRFILLRDQTCRTPWCDAAIHDVDHATRHADGGETTTHNGIGHCQRFNQVKEIRGWESSVRPAVGGDPSTLTITTPTGHQYSSQAPSLRPVTGEDEHPRAMDSDPDSLTDRSSGGDDVGEGSREVIEPRAS